MRLVALLALMWLVPFGVFKAGVWVMGAASGRTATPEPLNTRFGGYGTEDAMVYWGGIRGREGREGLDAEMLFLEADLVFPFFYGGALAVSLLIGWALVGRCFPPGLCFLPVAIAVVADWIENLVQIGQLSLFTANQPLGDAAVSAASAATRIKLVALTACVLGVAVLTAWAVGARAAASRTR